MAKEMNADRWASNQLMLTAYAAGFTLTEIGRFFGGISRQGAQQRLATMPGYKPRPGRPRADPPLPAWQIRYAQLLCDTGAQKSLVLWLLSIEPWRAGKVASRSTSSACSKPGERFKTEYASAVYVNLKYSLLIHAWRQGASIRDLAEIFGTTAGWICTLMHKLRAEGHDLSRPTFPRHRRIRRTKK